MRKILLIVLTIGHFTFAQNDLKHMVYFETDKYEISSTEEDRFNYFLNNLDSLDVKKILIYGFCDDRGTEPYNLWLSDKRAQAVKLFFEDHEVSGDLITVLDGKGELELDVNTENISVYRQNNRRVDVEVIPANGKEEMEIEIPTAQTILKGELKVGDKIRLKNIYFKTGYSTVIAESIPTLKEVAEILVEKKDVYFTIEGHVCCTHDTYDAVDRRTNKRNLSVARAKFIYNYLIRKGVEKHRMKYVGLRRKFPLGGDPKYDRRVEIEITHISNKSN